ncbi:hypothetical protein KQI86_08700 [Clostridium sp. MSJ-11]|uniref:Uncharacterized protein n=1 Tax=Clostridium mobile TaxID=2841512 RepID=A0ABS6EIY8_9CLOT|nr:hypothetical protein [Clostridium mobile]MBU5484405.1 hypothetical protein [Clostridium mobile]
MVLIIQCIIICGLFTLMVLPPLYKNPLNCIMSYPTAIRQRVESLPQYRSSIKKYETRHITIKLLFALLCIILMAIIAWASGSRRFIEAFIHIFILFFVVNLYDLFILDIWLFCHNKRVIIPGTEDMVKEYKSPVHHIKGAIIGTLIGLIVATASSGIIALFNFFVYK